MPNPKPTLRTGIWLASATALLLAAPLTVGTWPTASLAQSSVQSLLAIKYRNTGVSRAGATKLPRREADQAVFNGWPLYRNDRGQQAFNDAMATLKATDGAPPSPRSFRECTGLMCNLTLPALTTNGWLPAGRIWVSPSEYVIFAHSPRLGAGQPYPRRKSGDMKVFVFHEFLSSSGNTDVYDTIAAHKSRVFVPFYMSKPGVDAKGRHFVIVVEVAPYDVVSVHATNHGSAGPGIEVAKNSSDPAEPLQHAAGILVATIVKAAAPNLQVVNHHGNEGLPMLEAYDARLSKIADRHTPQAVLLPFVPALPERVAAATGEIGDVIRHRAIAHDSPSLIGPITLATRPHISGAR